MKYISILAVVAIALVIGWFIVTSDSSSDYVVMVNDDVSALEQELVAVEAQVQAGALSPPAANEARGRIINRINAIQASAAASGKVELTVGQRQQLSDGLDRLKNILLIYQATLVAVDTTADADNRSIHSATGATLTEQLADTVDSFEDIVTQVDETYAPDPSVDAAIDVAVNEAEAITSVDLSSSTDDGGTMSGDTTPDDSQTSDDSATTTEEGAVIDVSGTTTVDQTLEDPNN